MINKRRRALRYGFFAEICSAIYLIIKGWKIMALRHRNHFGEIDIIAMRMNIVIFVEVKARKTVEEAIVSVSDKSQKRIKNASKNWIAKQINSNKFSYRYDLIAIIPWRLPKHFTNAF
ncbi:YraN family protein [Candidatus Liberibacter americanus]|uniref:UPF0102 protein lam_096 n=1 Tax=Candidatus Liberibacter americanus str. Sao Paulo TaxID=1261131 RepID=U6B6V5_9HYPH|nr:YraN family protein [Candidatus Liberibacter americanus]AHA27477.1 putative endonuclease protein [Candidatus Liberibacter americanus str. Sao Paulo]EMS36562.1 hypothetical protein G653_01357 [Candidatus Liberibacter americanus PW_SP]